MKSKGSGWRKACKPFTHAWSPWANMGGGSDQEFRECLKCGQFQGRTRK
ncbi:MAG TPA: hypothetical protein VIY48_19105 [Candidatus Paceibacterota bacterium]